MSTVNGPCTVVGLSGGVDSSVAAWLLKEQGHRVVGVTLGLWRDVEEVHSRSCCSPAAVNRAKAVADHLGIPHVVVDATRVFKEKVVDYFVAEYSSGRTPNPCSKCNAAVRFAALLDAARRLGARSVATGHYAQLTGDPPRLLRGRDCRKDQSYALAEVSPGLLEQVIFPMGVFTKEEARRMAVQAGLERLVAEESQEICFVRDDDYRSFLRERLGERPGAIVDPVGRVLGQHKGTYNYTIGQRRGLACSAAQPLYVLDLDAERAEVRVGPLSAGAVGAISVSAPVVHREVPGGPVEVQCRSSGAPVEARVCSRERITLVEPAYGIAPGQTAVLYAGGKVLLAGTIVETVSWSSLRHAS